MFVEPWFADTSAAAPSPVPSLPRLTDPGVASNPDDNCATAISQTPNLGSQPPRQAIYAPH
jgi:hypothetical protein